MKRILVTGANGQLGSELRFLSKGLPDYIFDFTDYQELDITRFETVQQYMQQTKPDAVINCAAYTAVDLAESEQEMCDAINVIGVENLARCTNQLNIPIIHFSTDFVFDGNNHIPYKEYDAPAPLAYYGKSKLEGEKRLAAATKMFVLIRTSWVYSSYGKNFVKTIQRLASERNELNVIFDQVGTPTYARHLAAAVLQIIPQLSENFGVYNYSNEGVCSWYDFACAIVEQSALNCKINPIETFQYPTPAKRPHYSVLNKGKFKETFQQQIPHWLVGLKECIEAMKNEK